jgi:hypothetical protein
MHQACSTTLAGVSHKFEHLSQSDHRPVNLYSLTFPRFFINLNKNHYVALWDAGTRLGDLKENWFIQLNTQHTLIISEGIRGASHAGGSFSLGL